MFLFIIFAGALIFPLIGELPPRIIRGVPSLLYHKRLVPAVKAKKQITHKITGPEAPLNSKLKNLKEIESLEKISRTTTIENAEIAQIATPIVPAGCSLMISKNQLSGIE